MGMYAPIRSLNKNFRLSKANITDGGEEFFLALEGIIAPTGRQILNNELEEEVE